MISGGHCMKLMVMRVMLVVPMSVMLMRLVLMLSYLKGLV
jgi:hypothetical protein